MVDDEDLAGNEEIIDKYLNEESVEYKEAE